MVLVGTPIVLVGVPMVLVGVPMVLVGEPMVLIGVPIEMVGVLLLGEELLDFGPHNLDLLILSTAVFCFHFMQPHVNGPNHCNPENYYNRNIIVGKKIMKISS
ncbi:hypothetical protein [Flavobacterium sp. N3904]|uniref:hypothetical protein n=1 Tax=Flavobacterium sp. N3904 TaxID=2986835 RepID=UPI0022258BB7|nr:hypothetical protein [Flavobacterium sp. N3904]